RAAIEKLDAAIDVHRRHAASPNWIDGVEGGLPRTNGGSNGASGGPTSPPAVFRREGDYWTVSWLGNVVRLKDTKGLHYIAYLLRNPGRQVLACELSAAGPAPTNGRVTSGLGGSVRDLGDAGALLDAKAREQYRRRIDELREELEDAVQVNDPLRAARLR